MFFLHKWGLISDLNQIRIENATTINGAGRVSGGPAVPLSVTNVTQGLRYRLRFINLSCGPTYTVSIDNHNMTVIEADGVEINPLTVNSFNIFPAQRYSVVVTADQPIDNYCTLVLPFDRGTFIYHYRS